MHRVYSSSRSFLHSRRFTHTCLFFFFSLERVHLTNPISPSSSVVLCAPISILVSHETTPSPPTHNPALLASPTKYPIPIPVSFRLSVCLYSISSIEVSASGPLASRRSLCSCALSYRHRNPVRFGSSSLNCACTQYYVYVMTSIAQLGA